MSRPKKSELATALWARTYLAHVLMAGSAVGRGKHHDSEVGWMDCQADSCRNSFDLFLRMQRSANDGVR